MKKSQISLVTHFLIPGIIAVVVASGVPDEMLVRAYIISCLVFALLWGISFKVNKGQGNIMIMGAVFLVVMLTGVVLRLIDLVPLGTWGL